MNTLTDRQTHTDSLQQFAFEYLKQIQSSAGVHAYNYTYLEVWGVVCFPLCWPLIFSYYTSYLDGKTKTGDYGSQTQLQGGQKPKPWSQGDWVAICSFYLKCFLRILFCLFLHQYCIVALSLPYTVVSADRITHFKCQCKEQEPNLCLGMVKVIQI